MFRLHEAIRLKKPEFWNENNWFLHHDDASFHTALILGVFFIANLIHTVSQPSCLPDLAPCGFSKVKNLYRRNRFDTLTR